jgi:hypothetical protein
MLATVLNLGEARGVRVLPGLRLNPRPPIMHLGRNVVNPPKCHHPPKGVKVVVKAGLIIIPDLPNTRPVQARSTLPVGGWLKHFWQDWQSLGADPHVVTLIREGY